MLNPTNEPFYAVFSLGDVVLSYLFSVLLGISSHFPEVFSHLIGIHKTRSSECLAVVTTHGRRVD